MKISFDDAFVFGGSLAMLVGGWALFRFGGSHLPTLGVLLMVIGAAALADLVTVLGSRAALKARQAELEAQLAASRKNSRLR